MTARRMVLALATAASLGGTARAGSVQPPPGWSANTELSSQAAAMTSDALFDDRRVTDRTGKVDAYTPDGAKGVLYVRREQGTVPAEARDAIATRVLDQLRETARREAGAKIEASSQQADPTKRQLEASVSYRVDEAAVVTRRRVVVAGQDAQLIAVRGECFLPHDAAPPLIEACDRALATLDPEIPADRRVALAVVSDPGEPAPPEPDGSTPTLQPRLDDGARIPLPPIAVAPAPRRAAPDRRPIYVGAGLIALAALFYWNRRRRDRFERDDEPAARRARRPRAADPDADDLHA
ncbi:MAG: hypothetical protein ACTHU0_11640, partial [Kofleriaceae bacterium]